MRVEFASQAKRFLKRAETALAARLLKKVRALEKEPFPRDVKRVIHHRDKVFRVRVGDHRIEYAVANDLLFIKAIDKRPRAYR